MKFVELSNEELMKYFDIRELVSRRVYERLKEDAWRLFDPLLLTTLLALRRDILKVPLVCNNWAKGGKLEQRGYRENVSPMARAKTDIDILYLSTHTLGMAVDLSSGKMTANQMREAILANQDKLPCPIRMEDGASAPTWLHIDVSVPPSQTAKVYVFK